MRGASRVFVFLALVALGACGGGSGPAPAPAPDCPEIGLPLLTTQAFEAPTPQVHIEAQFVTVREQDLQSLGITWTQYQNVTPGFDPANGTANCGADLGVFTSLVGGAVGQVAVMPTNQDGLLPMPMVRSVPVPLGTGAQAYTNLGGNAAYTIAALAQEELTDLISAPSGIVLTPRIVTSNSALNYILTNDAGSAQFVSETQLFPPSRIVVAPPVITMNNQSTTILVPTETPTPADLTEPLKSAVNGLDPTIPYVEVGVALRMTPSIPQPGIIQFYVEPDLEFVSAVPQSVFKLNGTVDSAAQVPVLRAGGLASSIVINDGNTVILGGIRDNATMTTTLGVPIFANLPIIGSYLREQKQLNLEDALVILIKAEIVNP